MQWKSGRWALVFIFLPLAVLAGCGHSDADREGPSHPHQGVRLRVACRSADLESFVKQQAGPWAARQGVQLETVPFESGSDKKPTADVWIIESADLPHWASAGRLAEVPEIYRRREDPYAWAELLPLYREQLLSWDGRIWGLPVLGESPLCCYRSDWLADPTHQQAFREKYGHDLAPPTTWLQMLHLAEYFHGQAGKSAPSLPPLPADERALDNLFYAVASGYARRGLSGTEAASGQRRDEMFAFHYDLKTGKPRLTSSGFVRALSVLQRLQKFRPLSASRAPEEAFASGRAVLCLTDAGGLARLQHSAAVRDRVDVCQIPGGEVYFDIHSGAEQRSPDGNRVPYLGGRSWLGVVPRDSAHTEAAFALLADLSGPVSSGRTALEPRWGGGPLREDQLLRERWDAFDLDAVRARHLREVLQQTLVHRGVKNPVLCLRLPTAAEHRAALVKQLRAALEEGTDPAQALARVEQRWSELDQARGMERHREECRLSVGLLAR